MRRIGRATRNAQRGVVTIEYAFMLMFGLIPLLLLTYTGVMLMAVQQTLATASSEGARASLRYAPPDQRRVAACEAARRSMQWLLTYAAQTPDCSSASSGPIVVSAAAPCSGLADAQCMQVSVSFDYRAKPFLPGTGRLYGWVLDRPISSTAVAQLDLGSN
jgi:Flp pilus assembly protein TadG